MEKHVESKPKGPKVSLLINPFLTRIMEKQGEQKPEELPYSKQVTKIILCAEGNSRRNHRTLITPGDILVALTMEGTAFTGAFQEPEMDETLYLNAIFFKDHKDLAALEVAFSPRFDWVLASANTEGRQSGKTELTPDLLLNAIIREGQRENQKEESAEQVKT
jgi:hypothetical protein